MFYTNYFLLLRKHAVYILYILKLNQLKVFRNLISVYCDNHVG
jgi:hypothetical protein